MHCKNGSMQFIPKLGMICLFTQSIPSIASGMTFIPFWKSMSIIPPYEYAVVDLEFLKRGFQYDWGQKHEKSGGGG